MWTGKRPQESPDWECQRQCLRQDDFKSDVECLEWKGDKGRQGRRETKIKRGWQGWEKRSDLEVTGEDGLNWPGKEARTG